MFLLRRQLADAILILLLPLLQLLPGLRKGRFCLFEGRLCLGQFLIGFGLALCVFVPGFIDFSLGFLLDLIIANLFPLLCEDLQIRLDSVDAIVICPLKARDSLCALNSGVHIGKNILDKIRIWHIHGIVHGAIS